MSSVDERSSVSNSKVGRPIGSGLGKYTKNPSQKRKGGAGRPKLVLTAEDIEARAVKQRACMLRCYHKKRAEELERRKKNQERLEKIQTILKSVENLLLEHEELCDAMINDIHTSDEDNDEEISNEDILKFAKRLRKASPSKAK